MKKLIEKPHLFFFGLIPIVLLLGFIFKKKSLDIAYYGGDISVSYWSLFLTSTVFFGLLGLNYFSLVLTNKKQKKWLTIIHFIFQIIALLLLVVYITKIDKVDTAQNEDVLNFTLFIAILLFFVSVLVHLVNFLISLFLKTE